MPASRHWVSRLLIESVLIVMSILLAFALNGWWEVRKESVLVERALAGFAREIQQNKSRLKAGMPYHIQLQQQFAGLIDGASVKTFEDLHRLQNFQGFRPAFLTTTAWRTSLASGALTHVDYDLLAALSGVYTLQERFSEISRPDFLGAGAFTDANIQSTLISAMLYLGDVTAGEQQLLQHYDQVLTLLEAHGVKSVSESEG